MVYALWQNFGGSPATVVAVVPTTSQQTPSQTQTGVAVVPTPTTTKTPVTTTPVSTTPTPVATPTPTPAPTPAPVVAVKPVGQYTDGSYTGSSANAYYGTVQVKAVVSGGKLADVQFLQYPSDRSTSRYINSQAMPLLTQEAISAQNAQVNGVSGATFTSQAFIQSLTSALSQAKA
jgi:uncharacterized protein with FMN-binding domain